MNYKGNNTMIIIGAGIAGLAAGCYAQMNGYQTQIFEMHDRPGGLCTTWHRQGFVFDGCIHYLFGSAPGQPFYQLWEELGVVPQQQFVHHDELLRVSEPDGKTLIVYSNPDRLEQHLKELSPIDRRLISDFCAGIRTFTHFDLSLLQQQPKALMQLKDWGKLAKKMLPFICPLARWGNLSAAEFADRFQDPFLRRAIPQMFGWEDIPVMVGMSLLAYMHTKNAGFPLGGSLQFAEKIADRYLELGGKIHYESQVEKVLIEKHQAIGLRPHFVNVAFFSAYDPSVIPLFPFLAKLRGLGAPLNQVIIQLLKAVTKSWAEPIHQLRKELGLPQLSNNPIVDKSSACLVLAMFSSVLAKQQPDWIKNTVVTGFAFYDGDGKEGMVTSKLQRFLDAGEPPIVFTLGSAVVTVPGAFYQESIRAVALLNRRAVLLIGKNNPPDGLSEDIIAVDYISYSQLFPHACAIVHQGGIGTTAQALRAGRPTLIMPYTYDQPDNAARVKRLGTSRTIERKHYTGVRVAKELQALLENPNYATKAAEIGQVIQIENGVSIACDTIESRLSETTFS
jgi:hypothetical protein